MPRESGPAAAYQRFCTTHPLKQAALPDTTWRYIDCGRGQRTFLLIHGLVGDATGFSQIVESLESEYRVIAPTVPALDTMDDICRGLAAVLAREDISRVVLFGASWGGMVAQGFLNRYAEKVEAVVLADTAGPNPAIARLNARQRRLLGLLPWRLGRSLFRRAIKHLQRVPGELSERQEAELGFHRSRLDTRMADLSKERLLAHSRAAHDFLADVGHTSAQRRGWTDSVLILRSSDDPSLSETDAAHALNELYPSAHVVTMSGAGHLGLILRREEYLREIRSFVAQLPADAARSEMGAVEKEVAR